MSEVLNEVMKNNELTEVEEIDEIELEPVAEEGSSGSVIKLGLGLLALGGGIYLGVKKIGPKVKAWNTERRIKKLEADGFMVCRAEDVVEVVEVDCDEEVEETEE